ncbi:hypothetical protein CHS0354_025952 [Potamilus streckersoni]|uniref:Uncharacterized protein n=1 Tax=Potamilus streckersoni TaxID=2493646 RepID=A0AAE0W7S3_9BIVA|nr:hypothetical protein CHS0354_025952 [Potamilus streckersoni]
MRRVPVLTSFRIAFPAFSQSNEIIEPHPPKIYLSKQESHVPYSIFAPISCYTARFAESRNMEYSFALFQQSVHLRNSDPDTPINSLRTFSSVITRFLHPKTQTNPAV